MKLKLFALAAVLSAVVVSCSTDRDEEERMKAIESVKNSNQEIKLNKLEVEATNAIIVQDTIRDISNTPSSDQLELPPDEGGDPKDVPPRK